ncbi:hypothetical protein RND71_036779 [Anisodus tanguticus]|uniref:Uncharacterized protein n=1 Tax=Anisodus tanguticus TaxID=243964 RepID=A0AAE1R1M9_9SOLA|nr:hypothetical protein RND71_036779 [Anisodus tanguticus]
MTEAEEGEHEHELGVSPEEADDKNSKTKERDVPETSKNKSKKKMGGRTISQKDGEASPAPTLSEEDNIDIILVEIGEGQATFAPTPQEEKGQLGDDVAEKEEVVKERSVESAVAKKKKKMKEKEKEKRRLQHLPLLWRKRQKMMQKQNWQIRNSQSKFGRCKRDSKR